MSGTVISATTKCTLKPIAYQPVDPITGDYLPVRFTEESFESFEGFGGSIASETPGTGPCLLYDVPQSELSYSEEFSEGDYIIYRQKLGIIQEVERDAVLLLPDLTVASPLDTFALEVSVYANPTAAISSPDLMNRDMGGGKYVWTSEADSVFPGQSLFTERSNFPRGNRPPGRQESVVQGYVLATPAEDIHIQWLCPNVFSPEAQYNDRGSELLRVSALQENAVKCDFTLSPSQDTQVGRCDSLLNVGDRVRFRDPAVAEVKHPGYQRIPAHQTFGYDMNVFRITSSKTEVIVRWQDGSCTAERATSLQPNDAGVGELWPGDLVALTDAVSTVDKSVNTDKGPISYIPYFLRGQPRETLHLQQLGIVQTVESREQIASVRWYQNTDVELLYGGNSLKPGSSLGRLSDTITNVSVYELSTFPALSRHLGDLVVVAPSSVNQSSMSSSTPDINTLINPCLIRAIAPASYVDLSLYLQSVKSTMMATEWFKNTTTIRTPPLRRRYSLHNDDVVPPIDFFGKIVAMDTSGIITVRFPGASGCRDIQVPLERILTVIEEVDLIPDPSFGLRSSSSQYDSSVSDSDNDNLNADEWITEDGSDDSFSSDEIIPAQQRETNIGKIEEREMSDIRLHNLQASNFPSILSFPVPVSPPSGFAVLEDLPPSDHHFINRSGPGPSASRMRYIVKEFGILKASLPPGIFARSWESRMDLLRVMIIGPEGTPYEHAPFVIDVHFASDFPDQPPTTFFHSWTAGEGPINPNLYEDGNICLSILGTWPTQNPDENWTPGKSTILQVLVSIMGLVLVKNPFYNEAGYEVLAAEDNRHVESSRYAEKTFLRTRKFILHALNHPVRGLEDVLVWHYLPGPSSAGPQLLRKAIQEALGMIEHHTRTFQQADQGPQASAFCSRLSLGAVIMLKRHIEALQALELELGIGA
ncbi:hypothetical protein BJX76DRAFT_311793 [Aspergillus varians]